MSHLNSVLPGSFVLWGILGVKKPPKSLSQKQHFSCVSWDLPKQHFHAFFGPGEGDVSGRRNQPTHPGFSRETRRQTGSSSPPGWDGNHLSGAFFSATKPLAPVFKTSDVKTTTQRRSENKSSERTHGKVKIKWCVLCGLIGGFFLFTGPKLNFHFLAFLWAGSLSHAKRFQIPRFPRGFKNPFEDTNRPNLQTYPRGKTGLLSCPKKRDYFAIREPVPFKGDNVLTRKSRRRTAVRPGKLDRICFAGKSGRDLNGAKTGQILKLRGQNLLAGWDKTNAFSKSAFWDGVGTI